MAEHFALGIDIGGSHITCAPVTLGTQEIAVASLKRAYVDSKGSVSDIIEAWSNVILDCNAAMQDSPVRIGIAMPGPFDYEQGISYIRHQDKYDSLYGLNIKQLLADRIGISNERIYFSNDAACYLQGEMVAGAGKGYRHVLGLTLGTGFGSAIAHPGELRDACYWCAGFRGRQAEDYFSTRWFVWRFEELTGRKPANVKAMVDSVEDWEVVQQVFVEFGRNLAGFLAPLIREEGFELVVIGGNISNAFGLFRVELERQLRAHGLGTIICQSQLNENASLLGAANLEAVSRG